MSNAWSHITMMHNLPMTVECLQCSVQSCINKLYTVNYFSTVTIICQLKPKEVFKNTNYMLHWMCKVSTVIIVCTNQSKQHWSIPRDVLWYCERKGQLFIKCSLSHSQKRGLLLWYFYAALCGLKGYSGMLNQCHISGNLNFIIANFLVK